MAIAGQIVPKPTFKPILTAGLRLCARVECVGIGADSLLKASRVLNSDGRQCRNYA